MLLAQIGKNEEEANKAFSAAVQMHDTLVKAWALWGDYLVTLQYNFSLSLGICMLDNLMYLLFPGLHFFPIFHH
jgi:hypothetical protein